MSCYPDDEEYYNDNWDDSEWNQEVDSPLAEDWDYPPDDSDMEEEEPYPYE